MRKAGLANLVRISPVHCARSPPLSATRLAQRHGGPSARHGPYTPGTPGTSWAVGALCLTSGRCRAWRQVGQPLVETVARPRQAM